MALHEIGAIKVIDQESRALALKVIEAVYLKEKIGFAIPKMKFP